MDLVDAARSDFSGDVVQRISSLVGESPLDTRQAIDDAVPSVFAGMMDQASSTDGATRLYDLAKETGQKEATLGRPGARFESGAQAEAIGKAGQGMLRSLFGERTNDVANRVASHAGVSQGAAAKILAMVSPFALAAVGKEILARGLNVAGLVDLLRGQRTAVAGAIGPIGLGSVLHTAPEQMFGEVVRRPVTRADERAVLESTHTKTRVRWLPLLLLGLAGVLALTYFLRRPGRETTSVPAVQPPAETVTPPVALLPQPEAIDASAVGFSRYLDDTNAVTPKRFAFEGLNFATDSTQLSGAAPANLDAIAVVLKAHPNAQVRLDGHTDNLGDPLANRRLSLERATAVRDLLIARGVPAGQLSVAGYGAERPIAANDSAEGRAKNRRIELVVVER